MPRSGDSCSITRGSAADLREFHLIAPNPLYYQLIIVAALASPPINTLGDLLDQLGGIPASRVRFRPAAGEATEQDCIDAERRFGVLCELIDGTLVEKATGL